MKHKISFILPIIVLLIASCSSDDILEVEALDETAHFTPIGNPIEVNLSLSTLPFTIEESTRTEEPTTSTKELTDNEKTLLEAEKDIDNFWVFEYDKETEELIYKPQYLTVEDQATLTDGSISVTLSDNYGKPVVIYVVADADAGGTNSYNCRHWADYDTTTGTYPGFETIKDLEANTLPTNYVYPAVEGSSWPPHAEFFGTYDGNFEKDHNIPKSGSIELNVLKEGDEITVILTNMYAKLLIYFNLPIDLVDLINSKTYSSSIGFVLENIPCYCTVGALGNEYTTIPASYPSTVHWTSLAVPNYSACLRVFQHFGDSDVVLAVYVPENIQGENGESNSKTINAPSSQITSKVVDIPDINPTGYTRPISMDVVSEKTDAIAVHFSLFHQSTGTYGWYGPLYPGGNKTTNFNVRRNCTYRVIFDIKENEE